MENIVLQDVKAGPWSGREARKLSRKALKRQQEDKRDGTQDCLYEVATQGSDARVGSAGVSWRTRVLKASIARGLRKGHEGGCSESSQWDAGQESHQKVYVRLRCLFLEGPGYLVEALPPECVVSLLVWGCVVDLWDSRTWFDGGASHLFPRSPCSFRSSPPEGAVFALPVRSQTDVQLPGRCKKDGRDQG